VEGAYKAAMATWRQACAPITEMRRVIVETTMRELRVVPAVVLDPCAGAGTTIMVAQRLRRDAIGVELNPAHPKPAQARVEGDTMTKESGAAHVARAVGRVADAADLPLFAAAASAEAQE